MNKKTMVLGILIGIIAIVFFGVLMLKNSFSGSSYRSGTITLKQAVINVEIAETELQLEKGLSGRKSLSENAGMFFIFDRSDRYGFWMENMRFPIDIIWMQKVSAHEYRVIGKEEQVHPETYPNVFYPPEAIDAVLEINAYQSQIHQIEIGDSYYLTY